MLRRAILLLIIATPVAASCMSPTQITLALSTDANCNGATTRIAVGTPDSVFSAPNWIATTNCKPLGEIGTLVVTPSKSRDDLLAIRTRVELPGADCNATPSHGCIEARRVLRYIPHTPLLLPIRHAIACLDHDCRHEETCVQGRCVPSTIDPFLCTDPNGCGEGELTDASVDATPSVCAGIPSATSPPIFAWHFDEGAGTTITGGGTNVTFPRGNWVADGKCGGAFQTDQSLALSAKLFTPLSSLSISAWVRQTKNVADNLYQLNNSGSYLEVTIDAAGVPFLTMCPSSPCQNPIGGVMSITGLGWHQITTTFAYAAGTVTATLYVDRNFQATGTYSMAVQGEVVIGPLSPTSAIDELYVYDGLFF